MIHFWYSVSVILSWYLVDSKMKIHWVGNYGLITSLHEWNPCMSFESIQNQLTHITPPFTGSHQRQSAAEVLRGHCCLRSDYAWTHNACRCPTFSHLSGSRGLCKACSNHTGSHATGWCSVLCCDKGGFRTSPFSHNLPWCLAMSHVRCSPR